MIRNYFYYDVSTSFISSIYKWMRVPTFAFWFKVYETILALKNLDSLLIGRCKNANMFLNMGWLTKIKIHPSNDSWNWRGFCLDIFEKKRRFSNQSKWINQHFSPSNYLNLFKVLCTIVMYNLMWQIKRLINTAYVRLHEWIHKSKASLLQAL